MNLIAAFLETASRAGRRTAIVSGRGEAISFDGLAIRSGRLAAGWQRDGIKAGDRVLLAMPVGIELYTAISALWRLGATIVFPEPAMGLAGIRHAVALATPDALLVTGVYRILPLLLPELWPLRRLGVDGNLAGDPMSALADDHPALISFTSGSTGRPKAIVRSHGFLAAQNAALHDLVAPRRDDETDLVAFPVFVIANLSLGTTSVLPNWRLTRHDRAKASAIASHLAAQKVTRALVPPAICEVLAHGPMPAPLDAVFTGGGPVFPDLLERLSQKLPKTRIVSVYGSTEAEPIAHQAMADISAEQWTRMRNGGGLLAGRPVHGLGLRIIDDEIVVSGDHVNKGYLGGIGDAANKVGIDGEIWHRTGDAGAVDATGHVWLRGRLSARAGKLYPFDVEIAARSWPGVSRAALVPGTEPPIVVLEGREPSAGEWQRRAAAKGNIGVIKGSIPLDRRHRSKVDQNALAKLASKEITRQGTDPASSE